MSLKVINLREIQWHSNKIFPKSENIFFALYKNCPPIKSSLNHKTCKFFRLLFYWLLLAFFTAKVIP